MKPSNILITHGYSDSNKGDLAIIVATVNLFKENFPDASICLQSVYSEKDANFSFHHRFAKQLGVSVGEMAIPSPYVDDAPLSFLRNATALLRLLRSFAGFYARTRFGWFRGDASRQDRAIEQMRKADWVVIRGGQWIFNDQKGLRGFLYLLRILEPFHFARRLEKPIFLMGHSVGPIEGALARRMVAKALNLCDRILVREELSAQFLKELNVTAKTVVAADLAFLIEPREPAAAQRKTFSGPVLGISLVHWSFPGADRSSERLAAYCNAVSTAAAAAYRKWGMTALLCPQVTVQHHGQGDMELLLKMKADLESKGVPVDVVKDDLWPQELSYVYGQCTVFLGTRLHSCILAACAGTPVVAIRYQGYKTQGVMGGLGLADYVHDISDVTGDALFVSVEKAVLDRQTLSKNILERVEAHRRGLKDTVASFCGNL